MFKESLRMLAIPSEQRKVMFRYKDYFSENRMLIAAP